MKSYLGQVIKILEKSLMCLAKYKDHLEQGKSVRSIDLEDKEKEYVADLMLLTDKPIMYVCNVDEASIKNGNPHVDRVKEIVKDEDASVLMIAGIYRSRHNRT